MSIAHEHTRYYATTEKTLEQCRSHGLDHAAYGWTPQLDPRWTEEQQKAYWEGYGK